MTDSFGILSTYPPTPCGLATFTWSLAAAMSAGPFGAGVGIVEVTNNPGVTTGAEVVHQWVRGRPGHEAAAAAALNRHDIAVVQHEYGIYDGLDGDAVLDLLRAVHVPVIVVLHTVLTNPTDNQRSVLEQAVQLASTVVVMSATARQRLLAGYYVDPRKVESIAHGAPTEWSSGGGRRKPGASTILTWGLLGPGKGIEWVIDALATLQDLRPLPRYLVAGQTHPQVLEREGEAYRDSLIARASALGIASSVRFEDRYLARPDLLRLIADADLVVLPYDSTEQVTSGVLIEAVTARRPIVATAFPHAVELLSTGAGTVVEQRNPAAIAEALRRVLVEPGVAAAMVTASEHLAPDLTWASVAGRYRALGHRLQQSAAGQPA